METSVQAMAINSKHTILATVTNGVVATHALDETWSWPRPWAERTCPFAVWHAMCFVEGPREEPTLLITVNEKVKELTMRGIVLRVLHPPTTTERGMRQRYAFGVSYLHAKGIIAVSVSGYGVDFISYLSGTLIRRIGDGPCRYAWVMSIRLPEAMGVQFTADGRHVLVADRSRDVVSKFDVDSGSYVGDVATWENNRIHSPTQILVTGAGDLVISCVDINSSEHRLLYVDVAGITQRVVVIHTGLPVSLTWFHTDVSFVSGESIRVIPDAWQLRQSSVWIGACLHYQPGSVLSGR